MKKINILYWTFTGLFGAFMFFTAIPDIKLDPEAVEFMTRQLGYPVYFVSFIGVAKTLGVIAILVPGFPRIKEWAYAGLTFDLLAAIYSICAAGMANASMLFMILPLGLGALSYIYYHKRLRVKAAVTL